MSLVLQLTSQAEALAALGAHLREGAEGLAVAPDVSARLAHVARALGCEGSADEARAAVGAARAFLRQALDLLEHPERPSGWAYDDPIVLQAQGRGSAPIAAAIAELAAQLGDLATRLAAPHAAILDIGSGVGWLSIALARTYPAARVVGLDTWPAALALAASNVSAEGLGARVVCRAADVTTLEDLAAYDAAWIPGPFLSRDACVAALPRVRAALRDGGWAFFGLYGGPADPLSMALADLRAVRSGGHPWSTDEAAEALRGAGFVDVEARAHGARAPVRLVVGRAR